MSELSVTLSSRSSPLKIVRMYVVEHVLRLFLLRKDKDGTAVELKESVDQ
jgi:hypothetical protein